MALIHDLGGAEVCGSVNPSPRSCRTSGARSTGPFEMLVLNLGRLARSWKAECAGPGGKLTVIGHR
jgi:hypothetical protein